MNERNENKYRYPLSQMDEMPDFKVNIFVYNPKVKSNEANIWKKYECCEEFIL